MNKEQLIINLKKNIPSSVLYGTLNYQGKGIMFDEFIDKVIANANDLPEDVNLLINKIQGIINAVQPASEQLLNLMNIIDSNPSYCETITLTDGISCSYRDVILDKYKKRLIDSNFNIVVGERAKTIEEFYNTFINNRRITFEDLQKRVQESIDRSLSNETEYNKNKILSYVINPTSNETLNDFLLNDIVLCIEGDEVYFGEQHAPIEYFINDAINGVRMKLYNNTEDNVAGVDLIVPENEPLIDEMGTLIPEGSTNLFDILTEYNRLICLFRTTSTQAQLDDVNKYHEFLIKEVDENPNYFSNPTIQELESKYKKEYEEVSKRVVKVNFSSKELNETLQFTIKDLVSNYKNATDKSSFSMAAKSQFDIKNNCDKIGIRNRATNQLFDDLNELANYQVSLLKEERRDVLMNQNTVEERKENGKIVFLNKIRHTKDAEEQRRKAEAFEKAKGSSEITREILETQGIKLN